MRWFLREVHEQFTSNLSVPMFLLHRRRVLHEVRTCIKHLTSITTSTSRFLHTSPIIEDPSLTLYFLKNSCGLSSESALSASKLLHLKATKKPHSVLALLKDYGFTGAQITRIVSRRPRLLLASPHKTLKPKLEFYLTLGLSGPDLTRILSQTPDFLLSSMKNRLIPNLDQLRSLVHTNANIVTALKNSPSLLLCDLQKHLLPKIETLRNSDLPDSVISKVVTSHPRCLIERSSRFDKAFAAAKEMGINPNSPMFAHALGVLSKLPDSIWERKLENYRSLGWSTDDALRAFAKHPYCMSASDEKVRKSMDFFMKELEWKPAYVSANPSLLSLSFDKRIVPRCLVLRILASKGLFKGNLGACHFTLGEKEFLKKYVSKYQSQVPEVVDAIMGKVGLADLETECEALPLS